MPRDLQRFILGLLLILLPTQLGLHFWPEWAHIGGIRIDYFSPTLYFTDVLVFLLFCLEIQNSKFKIQNCPFDKLRILSQSKDNSKVKSLLVFCGAGLLIYLNITHSLSPFVSLYKWIKVAEFGFLVWFVATRGRKLLPGYEKLLLIPVFYESILAIWQFVEQSSVGGAWYWFGERMFNSGTLGIANTYINGQLVLRPYGTFPHPNVLGGFLAVVLPLVLARFLHNSRRINVLGKLGELGLLGLGYTGLFLSMSRVAILVGVVATVWIVATGLGKKFLWGTLGLVGVFGLILLPRFLALGLDTEPAVVRGQLNVLAIKEFTRSPIWGQGLGTAPIFASWESLGQYGWQIGVKNYALAYQPVHNIYLLALAETGVWGLAALGILGWWAIKKRSVPLLSIFVLGLADHYFLTLQQGQLLLALISGLVLVRINELEKSA